MTPPSETEAKTQASGATMLRNEEMTSAETTSGETSRTTFLRAAPQSHLTLNKGGSTPMTQTILTDPTAPTTPTKAIHQTTVTPTFPPFTPTIARLFGSMKSFRAGAGTEKSADLAFSRRVTRVRFLHL